MSRRRKVYKKEERVDSRYGSPAVARLISTVMKRGKKSLAERIVYPAIDRCREGSEFAQSQVSARADPEHRDCCTHRCRQDDADRARPVLYGHDSQDR